MLFHNQLYYNLIMEIIDKSCNGNSITVINVTKVCCKIIDEDKRRILEISCEDNIIFELRINKNNVILNYKIMNNKCEFTYEDEDEDYDLEKLECWDLHAKMEQNKILSLINNNESYCYLYSEFMTTLKMDYKDNKFTFNVTNEYGDMDGPLGIDYIYFNESSSKIIKDKLEKFLF